MPKVVFREERCKSCGQCVIACPVKIIGFTDRINEKGYRPAGIPAELMEKCIGCTSCGRMCPDLVITVYK
jgi:2-oxoglutarate ferredoxin oxidoreductase subunit delta